MADAFLHRRSILDKHRDEFGLNDLLKQRRASRSWDSPITRHKREKGILDWAGSFAGKRHYRKLARYNATHMHEENMDKLNIPATYCGHTLTLEDGSVVTGISPGIRGKCNITINAVREGDFIRLIPDWDEQGNVFDREEHSKYELDYTNHGTKYAHSIAYLNDLGALARHKAFHLCEERMSYDIKDLRDKLCTYLKNEVEKAGLGYDVKKLEDSPYPSLAITNKPDDGHYYLEGYLVELKPSDVRFKYQYNGHPHEEVVIVGDDAQDLDVIARYLLAQVEPKVAEEASLSNQEIIDAVMAADAATQSNERPFDIETDDKGYRVDVWLKLKGTGEYLENPSWGVITSTKQIATYSIDKNGSADIIAESPYESPECIKAFFTDEFKQYGAKSEAYEGARFGKHDIIQALAKALHNDEDDKYSIRYFDSSKVGIEPGYAYASNKEGEDAWKVLDDGTVEFEFAGKPQGKLKVGSLDKLESAILKLFGMQAPRGRAGEGYGDAGASGYNTYVNEVSLILESSFGYSAVTALELASDTCKDVTRQAFDAGESPTKAAQDIVDHCKAGVPYKRKTAWSYVEEIKELEGEDSSQEVMAKILRALDCTQDEDGDWYDSEGDKVEDIIELLDNTEWSFAVKACGPIQEAKGKASIAHLCDVLNRHAAAKKLPFKADIKDEGICLHGDGVQFNIKDMGGKFAVYGKGANPVLTLDATGDVDVMAGQVLGKASLSHKDEVADKAGFSAFVRQLVDAAFGKFDDETWDRITSGYDVGRDFEQGYSVEDTVKHIQDWAFAESKKPEEKASVVIAAPSFKPREYEGEKVEYLVYGLDDSGDEVDCVGGPVGTLVGAKKLVEAIVKQHPSLYFHAVAVLNDANGKMKDSEVVWSNYPATGSKKSETLEYEKGHKNSRGEDAPWVIRDHKGGKVLASFAKKGDAEAHLERMQHYSKSEDFGSDLLTYEDDVYKALKSAAVDLHSWDDGEWGAYVQDCLLDGVPAEGCAHAIAWHIAHARRPKTIEVEIEGGDTLKEALCKAKKKKLESMGKSESALNLADTITVPKWLWEAFYFGKDYGEPLNDDEKKILADFKAKYGASKYYLAAPEGDAEFRSSNDFDNFGGLCYEISVYEKADASESYHSDIILQILDQEGNTYSKEDLESKTIAELEEIYSELINLAAAKNEASSRVVADNRLGKIVKARQRDNVLAFFPIDDDGKDDDCTYFFKVDGDDIITKGYHWGRDAIDRSMIAGDGYPWTAEPNRPTRDYVHTKKYAEYLLDRVRRCLDLGVAQEVTASREVQAAVRSAWSSSGAKDFKLDIVRSGDYVAVYAKGPDGSDTIGIKWTISTPKGDDEYKVKQFATDVKGNWPEEPERTANVKGLDDLEAHFLDEFGALQETLDIGKESI